MGNLKQYRSSFKDQATQQAEERYKMGTTGQKIAYNTIM
jgi:hypothetical protein